MIYFIIPGKAKGKDRPKFNKNYKHVYTKDSTKQYEDLVAALCKSKYKGDPMDCPFNVAINIFTAPAKSLSKKKKAELMKDSPMKTPDLDNVAKIIMDALNKVVWNDDRQVVALKVQRVWSNDNYVSVTITTEEERK